MPFNSTDFTKAPWTNGVMTLTHEECKTVKAQCQKFIDDFEPSRQFPFCDTLYVVTLYNQIDWKKGINGDTYEVLVNYDPEVNTQGINEFGIVPEPTTEEETTEGA